MTNFLIFIICLAFLFLLFFVIKAGGFKFGVLGLLAKSFSGVFPVSFP